MRWVLGQKSHYVSSVSSGTEKKTAEYCAKVAKEAVIEVEEDYKCKVTSIVTDNEAKMVKMRDLLKASDPDLTVYGCSSHHLNLLGEDITIRTIMSQIIEVNKYFRNHHIPNSLLTNCNGSVKPTIPCATRWNSQLDCLRSYVTNRPHLCSIVSDDVNDIETRIVNIVNNVGLYREVKSHIDQLAPIAIALDRAQSDSASLASTCEDWLALLDNGHLEPMKAKVVKRFNKAMTDAHFLSNMLHPQYLGANLNQDQKELGRKLLDSYGSDMVACAYKLQAKASPFPGRLFDGAIVHSMSPQVWYECIRGEVGPSVDEFCRLAIRYLNMPASSAAIERVFSNFAHIQSKLRNRLGVAKAGKLVMCYRALRDKDYINDW